jgi:tetratricopeptide (TPR) repeat protein
MPDRISKKSATPIALRVACLAIGILVVLSAPRIAAAQTQFTDKVVLQGTTASSRVTLLCEVTDYTGEAIVLRTPTSKGDRRFPSSQVVSVKTPRMATHDRGLEHLKKSEYDQAEASLTQALTDEARRWVRREILADLVRCSFRQNRYADAGSQFRRLYLADRTTRHIRLIPLVWDETPIDAETRTTAAAWLEDKEAVMRLIGASLLLRDSRYGESAQDTLRALASEPGQRVRLLASWQEWRLKQRSGEVSDLELARRETLVEELDKELRPGPWYLIAKAHLIRQEYDLASAAFLRLPLLHDTDHPMTPQAMFNAARALEQIGFRRQALQLDQEVIDRYAWSPAAKLSQQAIAKPVNGNESSTK